MDEVKGRYFYVKNTCRMLGVRYLPASCYKMDDILEPTIKALAEKGEATIYTEKMRFVSGKAVPIKNETFSSAPIPMGEDFLGNLVAEPSAKSRKGKRDFD